MAKKIGKGNGEGVEKERGISWHFIYENKGNWDKMKVKGHKLHVRREMKENNGI